MAKGKLHQILAVEKSVKQKASNSLTSVHQRSQKTDQFTGFSRSYKPVDDEGERLQPQQRRVLRTVEAEVESLRAPLTRYWDVTATKDWTNCTATSDVTVDDEVVLTGVPITYLLFLEKRLTDMRTFVNKLPIHDISEEWAYDENRGFCVTKPEETVRTQKVHFNHVLAEATDKHPAQVSLMSRDEPVGYWSTVKFSAALTPERKQELRDKVDQLLEAVRIARQNANDVEANDQEVGETVFDFIFA